MIEKLIAWIIVITTVVVPFLCIAWLMTNYSLLYGFLIPIHVIALILIGSWISSLEFSGVELSKSGGNEAIGAGENVVAVLVNNDGKKKKVESKPNKKFMFFWRRSI